MSQERCQSCTMPIESGPYCPYCADESGALRAFDEVYERFRQWTVRNESGLSEDEVRAKVLAFMSQSPAWKDHPSVRASS